MIENSLIEKHLNKFIESVVETDEKLLTKYLEEETISQKEIQKALQNAISIGDIIPVLGGSATKLIGITPLIDLISKFLPGPEPSVEKELAARVFKTTSDPYVGRLSYIRVFLVNYFVMNKSII